jgi:hypothetical protein
MTRDQRKAASQIVHITAGTSVDAGYRALLEQLCMVSGPTALADLFAARLRDPSPHPTVLNMVADLLDPQGDFFLKLVVKRRGPGKPAVKLRWTKKINDLAIAEALRNHLQKQGRGRRSKKRAEAEVAARFEISDHTVRKAKKRK